MRLVGSGTRRRGRRVTLAVSGALMMGVLLVGALPVSAASTPFNTNLVKNPGAENGLTSWETFPPNDFKTHKYGPAGFGYPPKAEGQRINGGKHFFDGGIYDTTYGTCPDADQQWKLQGLGGAIDSGHVKVKLHGFAATNGAASLNAHLDLYFRDANNHSVAINGITKVASSTNEVYVTLKGSAVLPAHTRILRVHLWSDGEDGCQSSWDNISVVLKSV